MCESAGLFLIRRQRCDSGYNHTSSSGCREKQSNLITGRRYSRRAPSDTVGRRDVPYGCTQPTMSGADYLRKVQSRSCCTQHQQDPEKSDSGRMARILAHNAANRPVSFAVRCSRGIVQGGEVLRARLMTRNLLVIARASSQALTTPHTPEEFGLCISNDPRTPPAPELDCSPSMEAPPDLNVRRYP